MGDLDDSLYSRQRCVLGEDAMQKISRSKVFLCGLGGVGIEIAKNLILGGIGELVIQDNHICQQRDLASQFFIRPEDVDNRLSRAEASLPHLTSLNPYARVVLDRGDLTTIRSPLEHKANVDLLQPLCTRGDERTLAVECLIVTHCPLHAAVLLDLFCRKHSIRFIYTDVYGALGYLFCDFGTNFLVKDPTGEEPKEFFIGHIEVLNSTQVLVKVFADRRHQLETGHVVQFRELSGMPELNENFFPVQVVSPSELLIELDTTYLSPYTGGGMAVQLVQPQTQHFDTLLEQLQEPSITTADLSNPDEGLLLHHILLTLMCFHHEEQRFPEPWCEADWVSFNQKFQLLQHMAPYKLGQVDEQFVKRLALVSLGELSPLCAVFGGIAAQEAMKAVTSIFTPFNQWLYMHCESVIPRNVPSSLPYVNASRYSPLAVCIGQDPLQKLRDMSVFMVGCGAIGCELLKNLALLGVATAHRVIRSHSSANSSASMLDKGAVDSSNSTDFLSVTEGHQPFLSAPSKDRVDFRMSPSFNQSTPPSLSVQHPEAGDVEPTDLVAGRSSPGIGTSFGSAHSDLPLPSFDCGDGGTSLIPTTQLSDAPMTACDTTRLSNHAIANRLVQSTTTPGCNDYSAESNRNNESTVASILSGIGDTPESTERATNTAPSPHKSANLNEAQSMSEVKLSHVDTRPCITVTDPDHIEKSNLNRQFLFRSEHIGRSKSQIAALAARSINSAVNVRPMEDKVSVSNEKSLFTDDFLLSVTGASSSAIHHRTTGVVLAALDCVASRRYLDTRCVSLHLPLFESGTLGTKGHVQVVLPGITESYNSQQDDDSGSAAGDQSIPYCTLKSFPSLPVHCIEWAREKFTSQFTLKPDKLSQLLTSLDRTSPGVQLSNLAAFLLKASGEPCTSTSELNETECKAKAIWLCSQLTYSIARFLSSRPVDWVGCVQLARNKFERYFSHKAKQLLYSFPPDTKLADGSPFWQLPKRQPTPISFNSSDPLHQLFVISYARLLADQLGIFVPEFLLHPENTALGTHVEACLIGYTPPPFVPSSSRIITDESESPTQETEKLSTVAPSNNIDTGSLDEFTISALKMSVTALQDPRKRNSIYSCHPVYFQKDNDQLAHVDFITAAANLRALMYGLPTTPRHAVRRIAGRIVPAIATTTAAIAGLVCIELVKYVCTFPDLTSSICLSNCARNAFLNLALPIVLLSEPAPCVQRRLPNGMTFTLWDRWIVPLPPDMTKFTLADLLKEIKRRYALESTVITQGNRMVYVNYLPTHQARLEKPLLPFLTTVPEERYVDLMIAYSAGPDAPPNTDYVQGPPVRLLFDTS